VKVGGSLAEQPDKLRELCIKLDALSRNHRLIVVPGGGEFADTVRNMDKRFSLSHVASHRMAILGMDQYGLLLADLLPNSRVVTELVALQETLNMDRLPVFLPSAFLFSDDVLESSWDVTSDSIAVYLAKAVGVNRTILVTDVDGVFSCDPKQSADATLIRQLSAHDLLGKTERTSVDKYLPKLLLESKVDCFVVNGLYPDRIESILTGKETVYTLISGNR
jgi:hypothetical protein